MYGLHAVYVDVAVYKNIVGHVLRHISCICMHLYAFYMKSWGVKLFDITSSWLYQLIDDGWNISNGILVKTVNWFHKEISQIITIFKVLGDRSTHSNIPAGINQRNTLYCILPVNSHNSGSRHPPVVAIYYKVENHKFIPFNIKTLVSSYTYVFLPEFYSSCGYQPVKMVYII